MKTIFRKVLIFFFATYSVYGNASLPQKASCTVDYSTMELVNGKVSVVQHKYSIPAGDMKSKSDDVTQLYVEEIPLYNDVYARLTYNLENMRRFNRYGHTLVVSFYTKSIDGSKKILRRDGAYELDEKSKGITLASLMGLELAEALLNYPEKFGTDWPVEEGLLPSGTIKYFSAACFPVGE